MDDRGDSRGLAGTVGVVAKGLAGDPVLLFGFGLAVLLVIVALAGSGGFAVLCWALVGFDVVGVLAWLVARLTGRNRPRPMRLTLLGGDVEVDDAFKRRRRTGGGMSLWSVGGRHRIRDSMKEGFDTDRPDVGTGG